jgi:hypothetical protein
LVISEISQCLNHYFSGIKSTDFKRCAVFFVASWIVSICTMIVKNSLAIEMNYFFKKPKTTLLSLYFGRDYPNGSIQFLR